MVFKTKFKENEYFRDGEVASGTEMPINEKSNYCRDFRTDATNQMMPLFLSSMGRYIWSERSFKV